MVQEDILTMADR